MYIAGNFWGGTHSCIILYKTTRFISLIFAVSLLKSVCYLECGTFRLHGFNSVAVWSSLHWCGWPVKGVGNACQSVVPKVYQKSNVVYYLLPSSPRVCQDSIIPTSWGLGHKTTLCYGTSCINARIAYNSTDNIIIYYTYMHEPGTIKLIVLLLILLHNICFNIIIMVVILHYKH